MLSHLKTILTLAGIHNLTVKFEPENNRICADFDHLGRHHQEIITFEQIESLFSNGTQEAGQTSHQLPNVV